MPASSIKEVLCDVCQEGILKAYQINLQEAIFLCTKEECLGPLKRPDVADYIVKRKLTDIDVQLEPPKKKQKPNHSTPNQTAIGDDFLNQLLTEHDTCDPNYDISEIFGPDFDFLTPEAGSETSVTTATGNPDVYGGSRKQQVVLQNATDKRVLDVSLCDTSSTEGERTHLETKNNSRPARPNKDGTKDTHGSVLVATNKKDNPHTQVTQTNGNVGTPQNETSSNDIFAISGDFLHACMFLLARNQHITTLKKGSSVLLRRLLFFHVEGSKTKSKPQTDSTKKRADTVDSLREGFLALLYRNGSSWKPSQLSPACALPEVLKSLSVIKDLFQCTFRWEVTCCVCSRKSSALEENTLLVLDQVPDDFTMANACCFVPCSHCGASNQKKFIFYYNLPQIVAAHFSKGLPHSNITSFDFIHQRQAYKITQVIQQEDDNHFFTWSRNMKDESWIRHDCISSKAPRGVPLEVKESQYHMIIWQKHEPCNNDHQTQDASPQLSRRTKSASLSSVPNGMRPEFKPDRRLFAPGPSRTMFERRSGLFSKSECAFSRWSSGSTGSVTFSEMEDSIPSPSNSEVSNGSDGDVTVANSVHCVPQRNRTNECERPFSFAGYQCNEKNLVAHQRKWKEWTFHTQKSKVSSETKKQKKEKKNAVATRATPNRDLLDGVEIFLQ